MLLAIDLYEDFIDEESVTVALMSTLQTSGIFGPELDTPEPDSLVMSYSFCASKLNV
jgi:hypothetical protein